jgi:predicted Zn-dependent protease
LVLARPAGAGEPSPQDVLDSMKAELDRNMSSLSVPDYPPPYFISYMMRDMEQAGIAVRFGAVVQKAEDRQKLLSVDVRVGSPELDNTVDQYPSFGGPWYFDPLLNSGPLEDEDQALRKSLWRLTDMQYKEAAASFLNVKARRIYEAKDPNFSGCFTPAPQVREVGKPEKFVNDLKKQEKIVRRLSALIDSYDFVVDASAGFSASRVDRYFVNSEGSMFYSSATFYSYQVQAMARAEDGTVIPHALVVYARETGDLPSEEELAARVKLMAEELDALRKAPVLPPYNGPALLEGDTAGVFLHEALGHRLEGHRSGTDDEGGTFSGKLGEQILPDFITVSDDPTLRRFGKEGVNGAYAIDDEGVAAQKVTLVENGKLTGFLLTRQPVEKFTASNGHARSFGLAWPVARMGTLVLDSTKKMGRADLKQRLIELARAQGRPFALILRRAASGVTNTSSYGFQAFKGLARLVYKVDVNTGEESLVRGVEIVGTPLVTLMKIDSVGDDPALFNGYCGAESGWVPVSTITPSLLLSELEFQKEPPRREQKEILPPPK